jgi:uncharacterized iron-regulated protein
MKRIAFLFLLLPFISLGQDINTRFKVFDTRSQKVISIDEIVAAMTQADVLFFGEEHNDSIGHYLEAKIFEKLSKAYDGKVVLTLEMFHTDVQPVMDEYLAGLISEKNFTKEARAWNNYKDYRPMIALAKQEKLPVIAANASGRYSNAVTRGGLSVLSQFPKASRQFFAPLPIDTLTGRYYEKFTDLLGGHSMGGMQVYQSQNFWDATMAWSIAKASKVYKKYKIFQVNGRFHSDEKLGTVAQLHELSPKLRVLNIASFAAEDFNNPNWEKYKSLGDFVIVTDPTVKKTF